MHSPRIHPYQPAVLIADDEEVVRLVLQRLLEREGFAVLVARDGQEAVELFEQHHDNIRFVLLDVLMPRLDGPAALTLMRRTAPSIPACFMTGYTAHYSEEDLLRCGVQQVFAKPFRLEAISAMLTGLCPPAARVA